MTPRFVARQPILKADAKVFAYELLFRDGIENQFKGANPENASRSVLDSSLLMGLDVLCDGRRAQPGLRERNVRCAARQANIGKMPNRAAGLTSR